MLGGVLYKIFEPFLNRNAAKTSKVAKLSRYIFGLIFIPHKTTVFDIILYLHKSGHSFELAFEGGYEKLEIAFLNELDLHDKITIDIGACIGYYTLILSKKVGEKGKVISFEPEPKNFTLLQENVSINNLNNIATCLMAVGDKEETAYLQLEKSPGQHFVTKNQTTSCISTFVTSLDKYLLKNCIPIDKVAYIKIDAEGFEGKVLDGMRRLIDNNQELIVQFEYAPQHLEERGCDLQGLFKKIKNDNFFVYYWDLTLKKLIVCDDLEWFTRASTVKLFKDGFQFSRNIILSKRLLKSDFILPKIEPAEIVEVPDQNRTFIRPSPFIDFKLPQDIKVELPRSGRYFIQILKNVDFQDKKVLDIGAGYFGFLAMHAKVFGAAKVVALDVNPKAVEYAHQFERSIDYRVSDVFSAIKSEEKFDIIISNPPQLPSGFGGEVHDIAGEDGMLVIKKILVRSKYHLNSGGKIYLLVFDFLLNKTLNECKKLNLNINVLAFYRKHLRPGGETEKRKDFIEEIFSDYHFQNDSKGLFHFIYILEIKHYEYHP